MNQITGHDPVLTQKETATLAGGCFWCIEAIFDQLKGVEEVVSGYSGGQVVTPTYQQVCTGKTGHAEVVQVTFDPQKIAFANILRVFFTIHDPTTLNRQGPDMGTQYRSAIFYHTPQQKEVALQIMREFEIAKVWDAPIVTELMPFSVFYPAENYHQGYFAQNQAQPYCQVVIVPKVAKFRKQYFEQLKA